MEGIEDDQIFAELQSGSNTTNRPKLKECLRFIRNGDVLICTKLDRLAHSMADLADILKTVETKGANLKVLDQREIDTTTANGRLLFGIVASVAEFEHALIKDRQLVGLSCACGTKKRAPARTKKLAPKNATSPRGNPFSGKGDLPYASYRTRKGGFYLHGCGSPRFIATLWALFSGQVSTPDPPPIPNLRKARQGNPWRAVAVWLFLMEQRLCAPHRMISLRDKHRAETQRSID